MKYCNKEHYHQMNNCYSYYYKIRSNKITDNYYYNNNFNNTNNINRNRNLNIIDLKQNNSFYNKLKNPQKTMSYISQYDKYFYPFLFSKQNGKRNNQNKNYNQYQNYSNNSYNIDNDHLSHNNYSNDENLNIYSVYKICENKSVNFGSYDNYFLGLTDLNNLYNNNYEEENKCEMNMQIISNENQSNNYNIIGNNKGINLVQKQNIRNLKSNDEHNNYNDKRNEENKLETNIIKNNKGINRNNGINNKKDINDNNENHRFNKLTNIDKLNQKLEIKKEQINTNKKGIKKPLKKLSFHEKENVTIKYNQKDEITKILIFDANNRLRKTKPRNIKVYLSKLKEVKPKPVLKSSNSSFKSKEKMKKSNSASFMGLTLNKKNIILNNYYSKYLIDKPPLKLIGKDFEIKRRTPKKEICERFKRNPQVFYTEELCDLVLKSLDLDNSNENKGLREDNKKYIKLDKETKMRAYYNLKKYFEKNNLDD